MNEQTITKCPPVPRSVELQGMTHWQFEFIGGPFDGHHYPLPVDISGVSGGTEFAEVLDHRIYLQYRGGFEKYEFKINLSGGVLIHRGALSQFNRIRDEAVSSLKPENHFAFRIKGTDDEPIA